MSLDVSAAAAAAAAPPPPPPCALTAPAEAEAAETAPAAKPKDADADAAEDAETTPEAVVAETPEHVQMDENMAKRWMPPATALETIAAFNSEYITVETYQNAFEPEIVVMPPSIGSHVNWPVPVATVHAVLMQMDGIRKLWRMWWSPASAPGFTADMLRPEVLHDAFAMHKALGLPWIDAKRVGAYEELRAALPVFTEAARKHQRAMLAVTPRWLKLLQSCANADWASIQQLRSKSKGSRTACMRVQVKVDPRDPRKVKRMTRWELELNTHWDANARRLNLETALPKYVDMDPAHAKFAEAMQTRLRAALLGSARRWRSAACVEAAAGFQSAEKEAGQPDAQADVPAPFVHRIRFWVEAECAINALMVQMVEATAGVSGDRDVFTRATFVELVRAHELFLHKMRYLSRCASRAELGLKVDPVTLRMTTMAFVPRPGTAQTGKEWDWLSTKESLFGEEAVAKGLFATAGRKFDAKSGAPPETIKRIAERECDFPGTYHAWLEEKLDTDAKMLKIATAARVKVDAENKAKAAAKGGAGGGGTAPKSMAVKRGF